MVLKKAGYQVCLPGLTTWPLQLWYATPSVFFGTVIVQPFQNHEEGDEARENVDELRSIIMLLVLC